MLVRGLFARATGRALVSDRDWYPLDDGIGYGRDIPEGALWLRPKGEVWVVVWCTSTTEGRPIAIGSRGEVEQDTRDFILFGLPGGAEPPGCPPWRFDEGSLHRGTGDGSLRLMVQRSQRGGLVFVRHNAAVFFLGEDRVDALFRSADARLEHLGPPLHVWFAGRRLPLRGVGVVGVVGQAELARDVHIVLVHVDHDRYELHVATISDACGLIGVYTSADLLRGDLGAIFVAGPVQKSASHPPGDTDGSVGAAETAPPIESPAPSQQAQTRREPSPTTAKVTQAQPPAPQKPPPPACFTEDDRQRLDVCLTPRRNEYTGAGASVMLYLYDGFRLIMEDVLKDLADAVRQYGGLLRAKAIRKIIEAKRKAPLPVSQRTFTRGLVRFLAETGLGERVVRRFQLHLADWQRVITMLRANYEPAVPTASRPAPAPSHKDSPPAASSSSTPSSSRADASASAPTGSPPDESASAPTDSPPPHTVTSMGEPRVGDSPSPQTVTSMGEPRVGDLPQPGDRDPGVELGDQDPEPVVGGWRSTLRQDGRPTYFERLFDRTDGDSPSRFQGVNPNRGPPDS
ncbi:MAG: hypothetical protein JNL82_24060 [Myxococcales bacterium]|nr:hypothetical protein [Myxococcales bacterium]